MPRDYRRALEMRAAGRNRRMARRDGRPGGELMPRNARGFLEIERVEQPEREPQERIADYARPARAARPGRPRPPGRALHGLRRPLLPQRLPARQPDPGLERAGRRRRVARGDRPAARDQPLPRADRADLPGAVRIGLRAGDQLGAGDDQADRALDRRARLGGGLDRADRAARAQRPHGRRDRLRARPGWRPPPTSTGPATRSSSTSATRRRAG